MVLFKRNNTYTYQPLHVFPYTYESQIANKYEQLRTITIYLLLPLIANIYEIIPTHKLSVFICSQIFSKSNYPYLNVRKRFPKVIIRIFRVRRKFFRVRPCLIQCLHLCLTLWEDYCFKKICCELTLTHDVI